MSNHTASQVAEQLGCSPWFVKKVARENGIGYNIGGPTGYRFTDADIERFRRVLAPPALVERKRRRRAVA